MRPWLQRISELPETLVMLCSLAAGSHLPHPMLADDACPARQGPAG